MKKIMFNDRYGLTKAVLEGRKTMTRRVISAQIHERAFAYRHEYYADTLDAISEEEALLAFSPFKVGEVVAVAQAYKDTCWTSPVLRLKDKPGWSNKMFVYAGLMPNHIRITDVRIERLQDISDEDCMREGIRKVSPLRSLICLNASTYQIDGPGCENTHYTAPRGAFAALINKVSGKGTWESNPWVFVYEFELVKEG